MAGPGRRRCLAALAWAVVLIAATPAGADSRADDWAGVAGPAPGPARVIGGYTRGCVAGALALPAEGTGFQSLRRWRNRYWGHPTLVDYVRRLGAGAARAGIGPLLIADMAQPRGGPLPYGHRSHQLGLDVDILFTPGPWPAERRETIKNPPSMLTEGTPPAVSERFGAAQIAMLRLAAADPDVARIFVNFRLKKALCSRLPVREREWLRKIRPWYGHDEHFHVRLRCPIGSSLCENQNAIPAGDGCDDTLDSWFKPPSPAPKGPKKPKPQAPKRPPMPTACQGILAR